jgi:WhiB family redox-sensing transcriptional regulator
VSLSDERCRVVVRPTDGTPIDGIGKRAPLNLPCHRHDPNLWFAEGPPELELAKSLCGPCPVRPACLAGALRRKEPYGVWGGEIVISGRVVPRKRGRGRPRKEPAAVPLNRRRPAPGQRNRAMRDSVSSMR